MKIMFRLAALFYVLFLLFAGILMVMVGWKWIPYDQVLEFFQILYYDPQADTIAVGAGVLLLILNYFFWCSLTADRLRDKTIVFENPSGRVSVSLKALEDLIRREVARVPEVKEARPSLKAGKKGLSVAVRVILNADVNIPEMTSMLQEQVKHKIQDTMGVEEKVVVRVDVIRIVPGKSRPRRKDEGGEEEKAAKPGVPFQGYRA